MKAVRTIYCTAFCGVKRVASGLVGDVAVAVKGLVDNGQQIAVFEEATSRPIEIDFRGSADEVRERIEAAPLDTPIEEASEPETASGEVRGRGRPRLGVVAREVTLLPRHWEWLNRQPGGSSVALRRLVDAARRENASLDRRRDAQESANRFMTAMAGDQPRFEEVSRALFAGDALQFDALTQAWPDDVRDHSRRLAAAAFAAV